MFNKSDNFTLTKNYIEADPHGYAKGRKGGHSLSECGSIIDLVLFCFCVENNYIIDS